MSARRFKAGDEFEFDGIHFRVMPGDKPIRGGRLKGEKGHDLVMEWWCAHDHQWKRFTFRPLALMVDFLCENEDVLYPRSAGFHGGDELLEHLTLARFGGYEAAIAELTADKANRRKRDAA